MTVIAPAPLAAQAVHGRLIDDETGYVIAAASVELLRSDSTAVATVFTDSAGAFALMASAPGRYRLRASRLGYATATSPPFDLLPDSTLVVELRLSTKPVALAPLTIESGRAPLVRDARLVNARYYQRKRWYGKEGLGAGYFLDGEELERRIRTRIRMADVLRGVPGIWVSGAGGRHVIVHAMAGCVPAVFLDGVFIGTYSPGMDQQLQTADLVAVEVYPRAIGPARSNGGCAIFLWTGVRQ